MGIYPVIQRGSVVSGAVRQLSLTRHDLARPSGFGRQSAAVHFAPWQSIPIIFPEREKLMPIPYNLRGLLAVLSLALTAACGGGGGGGGGSGGTTPTYTVGGMVSGLGVGKSVVLRNNGGDDLTISANTGFTFIAALANGATYTVTVLTHPAGQNCVVANGTGSISGANVANVNVTCGTAGPGAPTLNISAALKQLQFSWAAIAGADYYKLSENPDGASGYTQLGGNLTTTSTTQDIAVHRYNWPNASYILEACNSIGCTASAPVSTLSVMLQAIGYAKASNTGVQDSFGYALALSSDGSTLAVGAHEEDSAATGIDGNQTDDCGVASPVNCATDSGAVYVYSRNATTGVWTQQAYVKASNTDIGDHFGYALALSGDGNTLAVGAYLEASAATGINGDQLSDVAEGSGAVYVFTRSGGTWSQQAYVKASNTQLGDQFGVALALSGDGNTLAVGAHLEDSAATGIDGNQADTCGVPSTVNCAANSGAVYVYIRSGGTWSQQAYVKASNTGADDRFGIALALSGDGSTLAVGAYFEDSAAIGINGDQTSNAALESGAVYVFTRSSSAWSQQAYVKASNTEGFDTFGYALALSSDGDTLAVGAYTEAGAATGINGNQASNAASGAGAVYVYTRSSGIWSQQAYVKASNTGAVDFFGYSLALSSDGNTLAVGAYEEDGAATGINGDTASNAAAGSGAVYLY